MPKQTSNKLKLDVITQQEPQDCFTLTEQPEFWDIYDPSDQTFWNEFFRIEEILDFQDDIDPTTFSITVQNHKTGEVRSYPSIRLLPSRKKICC